MGCLSPFSTISAYLTSRTLQTSQSKLPIVDTMLHNSFAATKQMGEYSSTLKSHARSTCCSCPNTQSYAMDSGKSY